ncbi:MAG: hypothetical protein LUQ38_02845 [Methanotrichaceae archaeon]|nr:hypothetical protein [Methanotrichaceae archaeon]MDD1757313.1 hypothetical protein [Methanotrichaceae archaeon]
MGLSPQEKERLINRPTNPHDRATNDFKVRRKLMNWLKDLPDMMHVFRKLPPEQLRKELRDQDVYDFLEIAERMLSALEFHRVEGELEQPKSWKVIVDEDTQRIAENEDIKRAANIGSHIDKLDRYFGRTSKNPIFKAITYEAWLDHPLLKGHVTKLDDAGMKRLREILGLKYHALVPGST